MNCENLRSLLDLEDSGARLDRRAVARHLDGCEACSGLFPEVPLLLARPRGFPRVRAAAFGASAAALLAVAWLAAAGRGPATVVESHPPTASPAVVAAADSGAFDVTISHEVVGAGHEHSTLTYSVWRAPTPKCLQPGRART